MCGYMHSLLACFFCLLGLCAFSALPAHGAARIVKVLPMYLDKEGLHTRTPNLFERDAYQVHLRQHRELQSGMIFAIQVKAPQAATKKMRLRLELRGVARGDFPSQLMVETFLPPKGGSGRWVYLTIYDAERDYLGEVTAWRASLWEEGSWDGETQELLVAEQKSFLW